MESSLSFVHLPVPKFVSHFEWSTSLPLGRWEYPFILPFFYLAGVFLLRRLMASRPPVNTKVLTQFHNLFIGLLSLAMFLGIVYGVLFDSVGDIWRDPSIGNDIFCTRNRGDDFSYINGSTFFWVYLYYLSKYYEWMDTLIIVLKKSDRQLSYLHVFHHCIIVPVSWAWCASNWPIVWYGCSINCLVHVIMYTYYFLSGIPNQPFDLSWKKYITQFQIVQFVTGLGMQIYWLKKDVKSWYPLRTGKCCGSYYTFGVTTFMLALFTVMFINYYIQARKREAKLLAEKTNLLLQKAKTSSEANPN